MANPHPNVIDLVEVLEDDEGKHLIMELCLYGDLLDHISSQGRLEEDEALHIVQ